MSDDVGRSGDDASDRSGSAAIGAAEDRSVAGAAGGARDAAERRDRDEPRDGEESEEEEEEEEESEELLRARLDVLEAENERLREEYVRARRAQYRNAAAALAVLGCVALAGAVAFPPQRQVLLALAGTGLFGAALTRFLTPERFVAASVAERVHDAHAANQRALLSDLDLHDARVYVPTPEGAEPAKLFVPTRADFEPPDDVDHLLVVGDRPDRRGVALVPTGAPLYEEFLEAATSGPASEPGALAVQLGDAAVETFELAGAANVDRDRAGGRLVLEVEDAALGALDAPDHPVVSLVGTGLAASLGRPVSVEVEPTSDGARADARVVYDWSEGRDDALGR